jgi:hypothetical protein
MSQQDELAEVLREVVSAYFDKDDSYGSHLDAACVRARDLLERIAVPKTGVVEHTDGTVSKLLGGAVPQRASEHD